MMPDSPLWISEQEVVSVMGMRRAIHALTEGLRAEAAGNAVNMTKTHVGWDVEGGHANLHAIGAAFTEAGIVGTKTWSHTPGGATPLLILFDGATGALKAIIEAFALGQFRTGSASGVATDRLALGAANELAVIGTGRQAITQVAAVAAVRQLERVRVYGRDAGRRTQFAQHVRDELAIAAVEASTIEEAVKDVPIVTLVTRAREPFLTAGMLAPGTHINAVGAIVPEAAEVTTDVVLRCAQVVVDSPPQARRLSRELIDAYANAADRWDRVRSLAETVASPQPRSATDVTMFKSLGMGVSDLALGIDVLRSVAQRGGGRPLPTPERAKLNLRE